MESCSYWLPPMQHGYEAILHTPHILIYTFMAIRWTLVKQFLLRKMWLEFGVMGEEEDWFQAYLSGRRQRVSIGKVNSPWLMPRYGVPQGSILMFVLFVNDLPRTGRHGCIKMCMLMTPHCLLKLKQLSRLWKPLVRMPNQRWIGTDKTGSL